MATDFEALEAKLKDDPTNVDLRMDLGVALAEEGRLVAAAEHIEQVIDQEPGLAAAHYNLGVIFGRVLLDDLAVDELWEDHTDEEAYFEKASACYKEAFRLDGKMTAALNNLARLCDAMSLHHEAKAHFTKSLEIDPEQPDVKEDLQSLEEREDFSQAAPPAPGVDPEDVSDDD